MGLSEANVRTVEKAWNRIWWIVLIQGLVAVGFGVYALFNPTGSAAFVVQLLGIFVIIDGVLDVVEAFLQRRRWSNWTWRAASGGVIVLIGLAIIALSGPIARLGITILLFLIGLALLLSGLANIVGALRSQRWMLLVSGIVKSVFGILIFTQTQASAVVLIWIVGGFLILLGLVLLFLALSLRQLGKAIGPALRNDVIEGEVVEKQIVVEQLPPGSDSDETQA